MDSDTRQASGENAGMAERELDVLATVYDAIGAMRDTLGQVTRVLEVTTGKIESLHAENAELRDGLLALSNRIEAVTRREGPSIPVSACGNPATHPAHRYLSYSDAGSAVYEVTAVQCPGVE